jgi:Ca2+-binding EF-hand superfamily protein
MKDAVFQKLNDEEIPPEEWKTFLKEYFFRYDKADTGEVGEKDFMRVLGDLGVYLSRDGFKILWTAVDFDLSGALDWGEIEVLLFEDDEEEEVPELEAVTELRQALQEMLTTQQVPVTEMEAYLEGVFKAFDEDGSGSMEEDEFAGLLRTLGINVDADKVSDVFSAVDVEHSCDISFDEFFAVVFKKGKKAKGGAGTVDDDDDE